MSIKKKMFSIMWTFILLAAVRVEAKQFIFRFVLPGEACYYYEYVAEGEREEVVIDHSIVIPMCQGDVLKIIASESTCAGGIENGYAPCVLTVPSIYGPPRDILLSKWWMKPCRGTACTE